MQLSFYKASTTPSSLHLQADVSKIIKKMKTRKVIGESNNPWVSPAVLVKKKDGPLRFCVDYRKLNDVTIKDYYPLPKIDNILDCLEGNSWFYTLDLKSGFWQVNLAPNDREKNSFFGRKWFMAVYCHALRIVQHPRDIRAINETVLKGLILKVCFVYLDDVMF